MTKFAEKLSLLLNIGDTLLARLHKVKSIIANNAIRPAFLSEPANAKVLSSALKKFPEVNEVPGFDQIISSANENYSQMEDIYYTFVDLLSFTTTTISTLEELTSTIAAFQMDKNPVSTEAFLDLTGLLVRALILMSNISDRRTLVAVFSKLYQKNNSKPEESYKDVSNFIVSYEQPIKRLQTDLKETITQSLGHALIDLSIPFMAAHNVDQMRKTGVLSFSSKPNEMCFPSITPAQLLLPLSPKIYMWIVYGFLLTPEQFAMPEPMEILKVALQQSFVVPLYLNEIHYIHAEYETMFSTYKSSNKLLTKQFKKEKKLVAELLNQSVNPLIGTKQRIDRRTFIRHELRQLVLLVKDFPGLLGPKIETIWGALSIAKEEVFWYFANRSKTPPKAAKGYQEKLYIDPYITDLLASMEEMAYIIRQYKYIVQQYYLEYLSGSDLTQASELINSKILAKGAKGKVVDALNSILEDLQNISLDKFAEGHEYSFQALRLNWFRVEIWLMSPGCPAADINANAGLIKRMNLIVHHTKNVDAIDYLLWDYGSLFGLVNYPNTVVKEFDSCLTTSCASYIGTWFSLLGQFPDSISSYNIEQKPRIGEQCVEIVNQCIEKLTERIVTLISNMVNQHITYQSQLEPIKAASLIHVDEVEGIAKTTVYGRSSTVGQESTYAQVDKLLELRQWQNILIRLLSSIRNVEQFYVYNKVFSLSAFLREAIAANFRSFILKNLTIPPIDKEGTVAVQRPSILLNQIRTYISVLQIVKLVTFIDTDILVEEVLMDLTYHPIFDSEDPLAWITTHSIDINRDNSPLIGPYAEFYFDLVSKRMEYNAMIYSEARCTFASRMQFRADEYCGVHEFTALAQLLGSRGIRLIDRSFLGFIFKTVNILKEMLMVTKPELEEFESVYLTDECIPAARKLRDIESFMLKATSVGNAILLRKLLYKGLQTATKEQIPLIYKPAECLFNMYEHNLKLDEKFTLSDLLALESGVNTSVSDPALVFTLQPLAKDCPELWRYLPFMFAGGLFTSVFQTTTYKPTVDAFTNNTRALIDAYFLLMTILRAIGTGDSYEKIKEECLEQYIDVAAIIILRLLRISPKDLQKKLPFSSLPSLIAFLDLFVQKTEAMPRSVLNNVVPYPLIRSCYRELFANDVD